MMRPGKILWATIVLASFFCQAGMAAQAALQLSWPTPNKGFLQGQPAAVFVQPTVSGATRSGLFGCVRNDGQRFHEGIDLKSVMRDHGGEALDPITAVMKGKVAYINRNAEESSYGRYIVLTHAQVSPPINTLYAHLQKVSPKLTVGATVERGAVIGRMGHSAGGYRIPQERAHLHLEINFQLSDDFDGWYNRQAFEKPNKHGLYNGMNLVGLDPLDFFNKYRAGRCKSVQQYIDGLATALTIRVNVKKTPDFIKRYPGLLVHSIPDKGLTGWDIEFTAYGLPRKWTPLTREADGWSLRPGEIRVIEYDEQAIAECSCRKMLHWRQGKPVPGHFATELIELMFSLRRQGG